MMMKKLTLNIRTAGMILAAVFLSAACSGPLVSDLSSTGSTDTSLSAEIYTDPVSGNAVLLEKSGSVTEIVSEEASGPVACTEVTDYVLFDSSETASRGWGGYSHPFRALILGKRNDGRPGLWAVYRDGSVRCFFSEEGLETSELMDAVDSRYSLAHPLGWSYEVLDMIENDGEIIILGYAENREGVSFRYYNIDPGTTVGVYWTAKPDSAGKYHLSRARIIGLRDSSWWGQASRMRGRHAYRHGYEWMWHLRMFFSGWFDRYLTMPEAIALGENPGEYLVSGTDQDGDRAEAVITAWKVLSIEKAAEEPENHPPYRVITSEQNPYTGFSGGDYSFQMEIETVDGLKDPDGDAVYFRSGALPDYMNLDAESGILTITNAPDTEADPPVIDFWSEDEWGAGTEETPLTVTFIFYNF